MTYEILIDTHTASIIIESVGFLLLLSTGVICFIIGGYGIWHSKVETLYQKIGLTIAFISLGILSIFFALDIINVVSVGFI